jgi:hypothetical protein
LSNLSDAYNEAIFMNSFAFARLLLTNKSVIETFFRETDRSCQVSFPICASRSILTRIILKKFRFRTVYCTIRHKE